MVLSVLSVIDTDVGQEWWGNFTIEESCGEEVIAKTGRGQGLYFLWLLELVPTTASHCH